MSGSKPIDELTIEDLKKYPIWEWAIDEEYIEEQDETWVKPARTNNFTEALNGSIVVGELHITDEENYSMMCSMEIDEDEVFIGSIVFYREQEDEYYALEDMVNKMNMPLSISIELMIDGKQRMLRFIANKIDIYKNSIKTALG